MDIEEQEIRIYCSSDGSTPFEAWLTKLDPVARNTVRARIARLRLGNFGDSKRLKEANGLSELRIHLGPGYRIYYGRRGNKIVILLCGGSKKNQRRDIKQALEYWENYNLHEEERDATTKKQELQREPTAVS